MRFLPSSPGRAAAEVLLTAAVVAFVVYDLSGHSSVKPEASSNVVLSFEAKRPSSTPAAVSRFDAAVTGISAANTFTVCGDTSTATNPWVIGNGTNQALIIQLGGGCSSSPSIFNVNSATNVTTATAITVNSGSWLSFQSITSSSGTGTTGATSGALVMAAGSYLETIISSSLKPIATATVIYPLLQSAGACPSFSGVNILSPSGCPTYAYASVVGGYVCAVGSSNININGATYCSLFLSILGALSQSSSAVTIQFNQDCSAYSPASFKAAIYAATGIPAEAISILSWACGSITVIFVVLGSNPALLAAAVQAILASAAPGGVLYNLLGGVTYAGLGTLPATYYPLPYCFYNGYGYCGTTSIKAVSSSNPALFALLTLLVIPVALILGIFVWCCLQKEPVCAPLPVCTPAPACFFPEPTCALPCDPCAAGGAPVTYMDAAPVAAPLPYSIQ